MRRLVLALLVLALAPAAGSAQPLEPGTRIRLAAPQFVNTMEVAGSSRLQTGTLLAMDTVSLTLRTDAGATLTYPLDMLRRLEVSTGAVRPADGALRGVITGVAVGGGLAATGVLLVRVANREDKQVMPITSSRPRNSIRAESVIGTGVIAGAVIGGVLGSNARERWVRVPFAPAWAGVDDAGAPRIGLSFSF